MIKTTKTILILCLVTLIGIGGTYIAYKSIEYRQIKKTLRPKLAQKSNVGTAVKTVKVTMEPFKEVIGGYGSLSSLDFMEISVPIFFPVPIADIFVITGQFLKKGDPILSFNHHLLESYAGTLQKDLEKLSAEYVQHENQSLIEKQQLELDIKTLESVVKYKGTAFNYNELLYNSALEKSGAGLLSSSDVMEAKVNLERVKAELEESQAQLQVAKNTLNLFDIKKEAESADIRARSSKAKHEMAKIEFQLSKKTIVTPFDAVISGIHVAKAQYLQSSTKLVTIADVSKPCCKVKISSSKSGTLSLGMKAKINFDDFPFTTLEGQIISIGDVIDSKEKAFEVTIALPSLEDIPFKLGMEGFARLASVRKAKIIPASAIINPAGNPTLFVVKDKKAKLRRVDVGGIAAGKAEIIGGLEIDEEVVIFGMDKLLEGDRVNTNFYD